MLRKIFLTISISLLVAFLAAACAPVATKLTAQIAALVETEAPKPTKKWS